MIFIGIEFGQHLGTSILHLIRLVYLGCVNKPWDIFRIIPLTPVYLELFVNSTITHGDSFGYS